MSGSAGASGSGSAPAAAAAAAPAAAPAAAAGAWTIDDAAPSTSIQLRLRDGSRLVGGLLHKLNSVDPHSLKVPDFQPLNLSFISQ
jgi:hypothetical protein